MVRQIFIWSSLLTVLGIGLGGHYYNPRIYGLYFLVLPFIIVGVYEILQKKRTLMRNYPIVGRLRYVMEELRPKIYQYFVESDTSGTPINRIHRSVIYQRAKKQLSTTPFGTQCNVYEPGYEWINHSMFPLDLGSIGSNDLKTLIAGPNCKQPYQLSLLNISAMSYGALSDRAIEALNWGAKLGGFAHNTGEGGCSPFHLKHGGDLIWQIGTGYFGCRTEDGQFSEKSFRKNAAHESVKMIEVKLSQGAKPGHGGILPASKNTKLIASIRGVKPYTTVESPSRHHAFEGHTGLLNFIAKLRILAEGKPIGFKLCFGVESEFRSLCQEMINLNITPDFIVIDGGEGGTGAAPLEFSNSIGMSLMDGLVKSTNILKEFGLRDKISVIASGKIISGFDIIKAIAMGADACYSARAMMMALGCIQALECNKNICPTGIATQDPRLVYGLDVADKAQRVFNFHHHTLEAVAEILCATGLHSAALLTREHIWRRIDANKIMTYAELYPYPKAQKRSA